MSKFAGEGFRDWLVEQKIAPDYIWINLAAEYSATLEETTQLAQPEELTRKWFEDRHEARSRDELERDIDNWKFHFEASERDRASLRATIADLEKRLKNAGVRVEDTLSSMIPWHKVNSTSVVITAYDMAGQQVTQLARIERPTPAKLTPEQMAEAWLDWAQDQPNMAKLFADAIDQGKSIDELYKESINGR